MAEPDNDDDDDHESGARDEDFVGVADVDHSHHELPEPGESVHAGAEGHEGHHREEVDFLPESVAAEVAGPTFQEVAFHGGVLSFTDEGVAGQDLCHPDLVLLSCEERWHLVVVLSPVVS